MELSFTKAGRSGLAVLGALLLLVGSLSAQETSEYFQANCASCHTIGGGPLTGPDLKNVEDRKDRDWLINFIVDPGAVIASGDAYAKKLLAEARNVPMPKVAGMTKDRARRLLDLIKAESKLERSKFAGLSLSDRPFTAEDVELGEALFSGATRMQSGAPACASCHTIAGQSGLGGGLLGPDLTDAYARLNGRKVLGAWLSSPATETMAPVFKVSPIHTDEILPLLAYMKEAAKKEGEAPGPGIEFLIFGVVGAVAALLLCDFVWRRRFTGVRGKLVRGQK